MKMLKKERKNIDVLDLEIMLDGMLSLTDISDYAKTLILGLLCLSPSKRVKQGIFERLYYYDKLIKVPHGACYKAIRFLSRSGIIRVIRESPKRVIIYLNPKYEPYVRKWFKKLEEKEPLIYKELREIIEKYKNYF